MERQYRKNSVTAKPRLDPLARLVSHCVMIPNSAEVRSYLKQCRDLATLLPKICEKARKEFGSEAELSLEMYRDPEIKDEYLTLYVRQPRYDGNVLDRIERVSQTFDEKLGRAEGYLLLTTDFRSPRGKNAV